MINCREGEEQQSGADGQDGAGSKAALLNGPDPTVRACSPVVAYGRLKGIAHAVEQGLDKAVRVHQYSVDRYGHLPAVAQKKHIHQYGGDAAGYVLRKLGLPQATIRLSIQALHEGAQSEESFFLLQMDRER